MSWQTLNQILALAATEPDFCQDLLHDPVATIEKHGWCLSQRERQVLASLSARDLSDLSQQLLGYFPQSDEVL